jgi:hypothetical protein
VQTEWARSTFNTGGHGLRGSWRFARAANRMRVKKTAARAHRSIHRPGRDPWSGGCFERYFEEVVPGKTTARRP